MGSIGSLPTGTISLLFTDIEASTRLLAELGRDLYAQVLERHRALIRQAIEATGGSVVDVQGDSLFAVFPSAADALAAAVDAERGLIAADWPEGRAPRVRFGLHTGEAHLGSGGYVGIAVHRAQRVCSAANGGQILISSATRAVLGSEAPSGVTFRDLGEVRLAGFDEPERVFQVLAEGLPEDEAPLQARPVWRDELPPLLERAEELAAVAAAIAAAKTRSGQFVVIEGPAGIGKTSILAEGRARAAESGLMVLLARGSELERAFSFGVVRQLFEAALAQLPADQRETVIGGAAAPAARLFREMETSSAGEEDAFALLHALYWLTANLGETAPLLLAIDDLQWADSPSLRWLAYLARRLEGLPVSVVATVRPIDDAPPLLDEVLLEPSLVGVRPNALSMPSTAELVRVELGSDAHEAFVAACHNATGGNPLLLRELLRSLAAEDVAPVAEAVEVIERLAPDAVTRSVRLRLARLPETAARLARAVAILGDRAERDHAAALARLERRDLAPAAAALSRIDLLRPDPPFSFVHPLVRNAVYESIPPHERAIAHAEAAAVLQELDAPIERAAAQVLLAPPDTVTGAAALLREAAQRAAAEAGLESAVSYLGRALEEQLDDGDRGEILVELADAEARLGAPDVVRHLREAEGFTQSEAQQGEVALALGHALYWAGDEEEGVSVIERALENLAGIDDDLRRRLEAELMVNALRLDSHNADARARLATLSVTPEEGAAARLLLSMRAYSLGTGEDAGPGGRDEALDIADSALSRMATDELAWNYTAGIYALMWADGLDRALSYLDGAIGEVRRRGAILQFSSLSMTRAMIQYTRGSLLEAEADARAALDAMPHTHVWFVPHVHSWLAQILVERGAVEEAAEIVGRLPLPPDSDSFSRAPIHRARAMVAAAQGDNPKALEHALALGDALAGFGHVAAQASYPSWRSLAALAHHALGHKQEALMLADEDVRRARAWGAPRTLGRALRTRGLIGGAKDIGFIREAVTVLAESPAALEHAYALANLGGALRRSNQRAEARDHLRSALEIAQRLGAGLLEQESLEELVAAGARPRRVVQSGAGALTPSERRIAAMAAEGLSNRDIAQALFVTLRTVEMHLSNAFRKLQISSRTQLATALTVEEQPAVTVDA